MAKKKTNQKKSSTTSTKMIFWVVGVLAICVIAIIFLGNFSKKDQAFNYENQPYVGKESAPVSIVEFGDYKCPVCKNFTASFYPLIEKELVDTGKAKFYFMNYSFINTDSITSAKFAESVYHELGNDTFWKFHELLYKSQPEDPKYEKMNIFNEAFLTKTLGEIASKEETDKVVAYFGENKADEAWDTDMAYVNKFGITGTPTVFINGKEFKGNNFEDFKKMVEEAGEEQ